jgi:hypothetical protein
MSKQAAETALQIGERVKPLLAGHPPEVQGAVLADLLAIWLVGHAPALREQMLALHIEMVRELIEPNEKIMFGDVGHPAGQT